MQIQKIDRQIIIFVYLNILLHTIHIISMEQSLKEYQDYLNKDKLLELVQL